MEEYKTTAKDLKVFARAVKKWQTKMGLARWSIFINHKDDEEDREGDAAWLVCDHETLVCTIALAVTWPIPVNNDLLNQAAFHECMHLLTAPLMDLTAHATRKVAAQEEHRLIVAIERLQFGKALSEYGVMDG